MNDVAGRGSGGGGVAGTAGVVWRLGGDAGGGNKWAGSVVRRGKGRQGRE